MFRYPADPTGAGRDLQKRLEDYLSADWLKLYPERRRFLARFCADLFELRERYRSAVGRKAFNEPVSVVNPQYRRRAAGEDGDECLLGRRMLAEAEEEDGGGDGGEWYTRGAVYCLYVDLFAGDFSALIRKLDYLADLGIRTLWLLPVLSSPMADQGFDIDDYLAIRPELSGADGVKSFQRFTGEAKKRNLRVIFDIALNHCSDRHPFFIQAKKSRENSYRDWFIWSDSPSRYAKARLLFKGMVDSNWTYHDLSGQYYFHRFYPFQPDLNFANPKVLEYFIKVLVEWRTRGVSGFRLDAVPFLWKDEDTDCENRPNTHTIIRIIRKSLDFVSPGTLLLAEACQPPSALVSYFGNGDECTAAFHFPLMPMIFLALARQDGACIRDVFNPSVTPEIPAGCQWFTFLRCHDELTLEMVTPGQRAELYDFYCSDPSWDFRSKEGISARLSNLLKHDHRKILLAFSLLLSLPGIPVIYYGDELAKENDIVFFEKKSAETGYRDSRFLVRGPIDWNKAEKELADHHSTTSLVYRELKKMLRMRSEHGVFVKGRLEFPAGVNKPLFALRRYSDTEEVVAIHNLSDSPCKLRPGRAGLSGRFHDLLTGRDFSASGPIAIGAYDRLWLSPRK